MAYWYSGNYRSTGYADGLIALSLGLADKPAHEEKDFEVLNRDPQAPAQYLAGWLYAVSGQTVDVRDQMLDCFVPDANLTDKVNSAMDQWHHGDHEKGDKAWESARKLYDTALASCDKDAILEPLRKYRALREHITSLPDWDQQEARIQEEFKAQIDLETSTMFISWYNGVPFNAGLFSGRIDKIFIDNVTESTLVAGNNLGDLI